MNSRRGDGRTPAYGWPGNVRELKNLIVRLHLVVRDRIVELAHLPAGAPGGDDSTVYAPVVTEVASIDEVTRQAVIRAIETQGGNLSKVAHILGISRPTLYRKLKLYGIRH